MKFRRSLTFSISLFAWGCADKDSEPVPPFMERVGVLARGAEAQQIAIGEDGFATVALGTSGFQIWNMAIPGNPVTISAQATASFLTKFRRFGRAGFAVDRSARLQKFDLSDMTQPKELISYGLRQLSEVVRDVVELEHAGEKFIVIGGQFRGLVAYQEREGELVPTQLKTSEPFGLVNQIMQQTDYLVTSDYQRGLRIVSLASWPEVATIGRIDFGTGIAGFKVQDQRIWVAALGDGVRVVDISDPALPKMVSHLPMPGVVREVLAVGSRALVAFDDLSGQAGIALAEFSDESRPVILEVYRTAGVVRSLAWRDGFVYAADDREGVVVFKVSGMGS